MKQNIFIIIGVVIVFMLAFVWFYLLVNGTPETDEAVFAELGLSGDNDPNAILPAAPETDPIVNMDRAALRQLTTKPVAGFQEVRHSTSTPPELYYVEKGTGHVFSINMESGVETRLSATTIAQADKAEISSDGQYIAITTSSNTKEQLLSLNILSTSTNSLAEKFTIGVLDFSIDPNADELLFLTSSGQGVEGHAYDFTTGAEKNIFSLPFHDVTIKWGSDSDDAHLAYPKTTYALEGFLYEIKNGTRSRLPLSGYGFAAAANAEFILFTASEKGIPKSYIYNRTTKETDALGSAVLIEKCYLPRSGSNLACAQEATSLPTQFPDEWYKGNISFKDSLWLLSAAKLVGEKLVDTYTVSDREIDVINLTTNLQGTALQFINKNDNTLWMYEI